MEPVLLIDKLANMQSYFESELGNANAAMVMVDQRDIDALQTAIKVLMIIENDPKIRKMVTNKYID
jgi:hypothetical protein